MKELILDFFLHKHVTVKGPTNQTTGKLLAFQDRIKKKHIPSLLILETSNGKTIWRGPWILITETNLK